MAALHHLKLLVLPLITGLPGLCLSLNPAQFVTLHLQPEDAIVQLATLFLLLELTLKEHWRHVIASIIWDLPLRLFALLLDELLQEAIAPRSATYTLLVGCRLALVLEVLAPT